MIKKNQNGFTLVELIITIVIVSIISLIAIYAYEVYVEEAKATEIYTNVDAINTAQNIFYLENGRYASRLSDLSDTESIGYYFTLPGNTGHRVTKDFIYSVSTDANGTFFKIHVGKLAEPMKPPTSAPIPPGVSGGYATGYKPRYSIEFQRKKGEQNLSYLTHRTFPIASFAEKMAVGRIIKKVTGETISTI